MTRTSIATALAVLLTLGTVAGCKGDKVIQPDPKTQAALDQCLKDKAEKDKLIKAEEDENAALMREKSSGKEIVVAIEGSLMTVKPGAPGEVRSIDDKMVGEAAKQFQNVVERSRGAIQKYTGLQARTVTLSVSASFTSGQFKGSNFAPSLGDAFDACIRTVASKWTLPATAPAMTFKAQVSLTPS
jgi:hypothetical protein